jgi:succinate dehydrogenase / fumarate reductase cytochrome b subunit
MLTGAVPLGVFILFHFAVNARAVAGPAAYRATVDSIARLPGLPVLEILAIALPIAVHLGLAILLGTSRQSSLEPAYPTSLARWIRRATGLYLGIYVVFHVWSLRLAPERLRGQHALFDLMSAQLAHPAVFVLQSLAVVAAAAHFATGLVSLGGPDAFELPRPARRGLLAVAMTAFVVLVAVGLNALLAFVWPAARWLS